MRRLVSTPNGFDLTEASDPEPASGELLVRVVASSVSPRDLRLARTKPGFCPGADFAGVVERSAGRRGPQQGDRVAGVFPSGAWSDRIAVAPRSVSVVPEALGLADAAAIAAAGLTALYALERCGSLLGKRVLITAANGQVGRVACQIAIAAGASVSGLVRTPADGDTAQGIDLITPNSFNERSRTYDFIIDMVGGDTLALVAARLRAGGRCIVVGNASAATTTIDASELYMNQRELVGFALFPELNVKPAEVGLPRVLGLWEAGLITIPQTNRLPAERFSDPAALGKAKTVLMFG